MTGQVEQPTRIRCQKTWPASLCKSKVGVDADPILLEVGGQILKSPEGEGSGQNPASWFLLFPWRGTEPGPHKMFCTSSLSPPSNSEPCSPCLALASTNLCTSLLCALYCLLPFQKGFDVLSWGPPHSPVTFLLSLPVLAARLVKLWMTKRENGPTQQEDLFLPSPPHLVWPALQTPGSGKGRSEKGRDSLPQSQSRFGFPLLLGAGFLFCFCFRFLKTLLCPWFSKRSFSQTITRHLIPLSRYLHTGFCIPSEFQAKESP